MLRSVLHSCLRIGVTLSHQNVAAGPLQGLIKPQASRCFSALVSQRSFSEKETLACNQYSLIRTPVSFQKQQLIFPLILQQQSRNVVKFRLSRGGRRATVGTVLARFKRLDWGIWVRRIAGAHKKLWKKSWKRKMKLERHVMINAKKSYMLDKMVSKYWRSPKYWVDDPYEPYHKREDFALTRSKPRPLPAGVSFDNVSFSPKLKA